MAGTDPPLRLAIQRRLVRIDFPPVMLDDAAKEVIEAAAREQAHDRGFFEARAFVVHAKEARATQMIIALNLIMFGVEMALGGSTNPEVKRSRGWARFIRRPFARGNGGGCSRRAFSTSGRCISP